MAPYAAALADAAAGIDAHFRIDVASGGSDLVAARPLVEARDFPPVEARLLDWLMQGVPAAGRLLDLGCGAGRHARFLTERGFAVTALDGSPAVVEVARRLGMAAHLGTIETLGPEARYDGILLLGNSLGMVGEAARLEGLMHRLASLAPRVILDLVEAKAGGEKLRIRIAYRDLVGSWFPWPHFGVAEVRHAASVAGFETVALERDGARIGLALRRRT